jgi:predicted DNA-binding protein with PD1-like motif
MQSKEKNNIIVIRLFPNEEVNDKLKEACKKHEVKTATILSGIGQLKDAKLGYFKNKGNYTPKSFDKPLEILSLTGNICKQDEDCILHIHAVLGDEEKKAIGGHFIEGTISVTAELILLKTDIDFKREMDKKTGLLNLYLK